MKNYKLYTVGDKVEITIANPNTEDKGKIGIIQEVRCSFCKILIGNDTKTRNYCYGKFRKI